MTAPTLATVSGWDVPLLRGAVGTLDVVAARVPAWRARVEAVGRALETAECWSGPAARNAAEAVVALSTAATEITAALAESLDPLTSLVAAAMTAQEAARTALAIAAAEGVPLEPGGRGPVAVAPSSAATALEQVAGGTARLEAVARVRAEADRSLAAAAAARAAAVAAAEALHPVPVAVPPVVDFSGVLSGWGDAPMPPVGLAPAGVAAWWAALSAADQRAAIAAAPELVGALDGVPAWARDRANRLVLAAALDRPDHGTAAAVAAEIERREAQRGSVQLWQLDLANHLVALAVGDVDTADAVAVLVPGILTTPEDDLAAQVDDAVSVAERAEAAAPGLAVAAIAWLGYRTPQSPFSIAMRGSARRGGAALDSALDGLAAARRALAAPDPRTTVLAHSYGTVVADEAARADGELAADAVVLLGSPGGAESAAALEAPEVYDAASEWDPVSWLHWFGPDPWGRAFGAEELPTDADTLHWQYYDPDRPTLDAIGRVVAGAPGG